MIGMFGGNRKSAEYFRLRSSTSKASISLTTNKMADSQEAEITTPATEENVEVPEAASAVTTPAAEDAVAEDKEEVTVDQEKEGSVKEEATKGEDEAEAATEQPKEDEAVVEESSEPKAEEATSDQVAEEGEAPPAETEEGAEQTEVSAEPASGGETTVEGETAEGETTAEGGEEAPKADEIPVTDETTEEVEGEKAEGEDKDAEGDKKDKEGGEDEGGEKKEGEEDAAAVVEGEEKPAAEGGEGDETAEKGESKEGDVDAAEGERHTPLPQSDTFAEGERPESPGRVGEKLSREPTPDREGPQAGQPDFLIPESPPPVDEFGQPLNMTVYEEDEDEEEQPEEEQEVEPEFDREALIEKYHATLAEREQLQLQNYQLQHKLAEYFRKKKADERQDYDKNITDQEQRYLKYMAQLEDLRRQDMQEREDYQIQIEDHKEKCEEKRTKVDEERQRFMEFKKQVALNAINTRSGKPIPPKDTEQYLSYENKKELEVVNVRLENIKLKNKLKKKEQQLKSKEELAEGLHLIDFEQLKIENQTYNEKIEERNEELLKLRKKITSTVQVLTHLKEKLQFVQAENHVHRGSLKEVEAEVAQKRDILSRTKQARDSLRIDNQRLRQSSGLLGNEPLLRDFEERMDESDDLRENLERMKMLHAELTLNCNQVRRKIEQARSGRT